MNRESHQSLLQVALVAVCSIAVAVHATPFPVSGGVYTANVASNFAPGGVQGVTVTPSYTGGASSTDTPGDVNDCRTLSWTVNGLATGADSAIARFDLGTSWNLSKLRAEYTFWNALPASHEFRISPDSSSWTTVLPAAAPGGEFLDVLFAATDARYIEWEVWGAVGTAHLMELMAYVDAGAAAVPQLEDGYNAAQGATVVSETGFQSYGPASHMLDGDYHSTGATPTLDAQAVIDLGVSMWVHRLTTAMYAGWDDGQLALSNDMASWTTIKGPGPLANAEFDFSPVEARYVRVIGTAGGANGHLRELGVFALVIPEPATLSLFGLAGLAMLARRRR